MDLFPLARLGRFRDIITVLFRYGFDDIAERLQFRGKVLIERARADLPEMTTWERTRRALEELGPTFVKFGQLLSLRADLLPMDLIRELERLQDDVAPESFATIKEAVEESLGRTLAEVFSEFSETPLAAASLAQVHRAVLRTEQVAVAVKVRRPGVSAVIDTDLYILEHIAPHLEEHLELARTYNLVSLVVELRRSLLRELNYCREARNMKIVAANFADNKNVFIPAVHEGYSNEKLIVMDLVEGVKLKNFKEEDLGRRERVAHLGISVTIKQILEFGFFHADPHPGNFLVLPGDTICLLDWGVVGIITADVRHDLVDLISAIVGRDEQKTLDLLLRFGGEQAVTVNERLLERDILEMLYAYHNVALEEIRFQDLLTDINHLLATHRLRVPSDLALMLKALVTAEGTARKLLPSLNVVEELKPYLGRLAGERWRPASLWRRLSHNLYHLAILNANLPKRLNGIIRKVEQGELNIRMQHENLGGLRRTLDATSNRIASAIITSSMIIGSSMIITTGVKPLLFGYPAIGIIGYIISAIMGIGLVINIMGSRKL